uniref:Uncharacterized protein n=1 Tax=Amphilophus citrinellus TaxID=61819 RepID=A0A3Q0T5B4_AMPCI
MAKFISALNRGGELDVSTFLNIVHWQLQQEAPEQENLEADEAHKGFILASELRAKLTRLGEKLKGRETGTQRESNN